MRKLIPLLLPLIAITLYSNVMKKVNIPEDWTIENIEQQENVSVENIEIKKHVVQTIKTLQGNLIVNYYFCNDQETLNKLFQAFFLKKQPVYKNDNLNILYTLDGDAVDKKNTIRFLEIPLLEQIKLIFSDYTDIENLELISEKKLSSDKIQAAQVSFGIKIQKGIEQLFKVGESKAKLRISYYICKDKNEAWSGYQTARKTTGTITAYLFASNFLVQFKWVKE